MVNDNKSMMLHAIRWIAALIVLLGHVQMWSRVKTGSGAFGWEYMGDHAHAAVVVFFVLSGFVISWAVDRNTGLTWKKYYIDRFTRIYSVLPIAIIFTVLIDSVGAGISQAYSDPALIPQDNYWVRFLVNLFSVQGFQGYRVQFGSNPALWSIGYEIFYYIVFGLMFFWREIFQSRVKLACVVVLGLFFLAGAKISLYFLIWLMGFVAYRIQKKLILSVGYFWFFLALVLWVNHFVVYKAMGDIEYLRDFSLGLAVAALFVPAMPSVGTIRLHKFMADFSYSLYVFHLPIVFFTYFVIYDEINPIKLLPMATVIICMIFAWLISIFTEKKRVVLRDWLMRRAEPKVHENPR